MSIIRKFIIVDDDRVNNILCSIVIESSLGNVDIKTSEIPEEGLSFIQNEYTGNVAPTVLFLDINMPSLTGWEFIEQYENFGKEVKEQITIYILSSSVDYRDEDKAKSHQYVKGFLSKPLDSEAVLFIATNHETIR